MSRAPINTPTDVDPVQYVWANNWAAVIGVIICLILLFYWMSQNSHPLEEEEE